MAGSSGNGVADGGGPWGDSRAVVVPPWRPEDVPGLPDPERGVRLVASAHRMLAQVRAGAVSPAQADPLLSALVGMVGSLEAWINALSAQRSALVALTAAVTEELPAVMVPVLPGDDVAPGSQVAEYARRALVAELATTMGASEGTTATLVDTSVELTEHLPAVLGAMGSGVIGDRHARQVVRHGEDLPPGAKPAFEAAVLARLATHRTPAGLGRVAREARDRVHPVPVAERHARASQERAVFLDPAPDGMAWLSAFLPAVQAGAIHDKLTAVARSLGEDALERRTLAQRRADVLTALTLDTPDGGAVERSPVQRDAAVTDAASRSAVSPGTPGGLPFDRSATAVGPGGVAPGPDGAIDPGLLAVRPVVAVTVPVMTLLGRSEDPGHLDGYGPIDPGTARVLAAGASSFIRILTHPETGTVLSVGRERYAVPADLRTWLRLRDQTCRFPGCHQTALRSEIDHNVAFREGGARGSTDADNLAHLCRTHHRLKHTSRWQVSQAPDATLTWVSPTGRVHRSSPGLNVPGVARPDAGDTCTSGAAPPDVADTRTSGAAPPDPPVPIPRHRPPDTAA